MKLAKQGIWMPTAQVLCYECHGFTFPKTIAAGDGFKTINYTISEFEQKRNTKLLPLEEGQAITHCDGCGQDIRVYDSVAVEHNLVKALREHGIDARMTQTGGMNSACEVVREFAGELAKGQYQPFYLVTFNFDGDDMFYIGKYDENTDWIDSFNESFETFEETLAFILDLDDVKKLEADSNGGN